MKEEKLKSVLIGLTVIFMVSMCLSPFGWMLVVSLSKNPDFLASREIDFVLTFKNYVDVLSVRSLPFLHYLRNSLIVAGVTTFFSVAIATLAAYAISRMSFPGRIAVPVVVLSLSMFPQISIVGYLFKMMSSLNWIDTYQALVMPYVALTLPLALWISLSYFMQIPVDLDKAALVDGATRAQILRKVILPVSAPGIVSTALLVFIFSFNEFLFASLLTTTYNAQTVPVGIALFAGLHGQLPWGHLMAASCISSVPLVVLALVFQRRIIQGLTAGAVRG